MFMPEWTIQKVGWLSCNLYGGDKNYEGRHFILCNQELWNDFELQYKTVIARVNSILDNSGKIIATVSDEILLEPLKMNVPGGIIGVYPSDSYSTHHFLIFSKDFMKEYGVRKGEYVDLTLTGISKYSHRIEIGEKIYPQRFVTGQMDIQPSSEKPNPIGITEPLLEQILEGEFYKELIQEINRSYSY